jgi:Domain of unknown function (DUF4432)
VIPAPRPHPSRLLTLESDELTVTLLPDKGADIYEIIDRSSGVDVMLKSPWGVVEPGRWLRAASSMQRWMEAYPGGWQVLLPNGGDECVENGTLWSYHGEAALTAWTVAEHDGQRATLHAQLFSVPLQIRRELEVEGPRLRLREWVENVADDSLEVMWSHHPAFGAPFLEAGCLLSTGFRRVVADDLSPGTLLAPGSEHSWPLAHTTSGEVLDLRMVPGPQDTRAVLAYLTDLAEPYFALTNPRRELGVAFHWSGDVFPHAWLWQEVHSGTGWPWYRRAYALAVEPATTFPGHGMTHARATGHPGITFAPRQTREVSIEVTMFHDSRAVAGLDESGAPRFE